MKRSLAILALALFATGADADLTVEVVPAYLELIPVSQFEYDFVMDAEVTNNGPDAFDVSAVLTSNDPNLTVIDGNVGFGDVSAGTVVTGVDPFVVRIDVSEPYDMGLLSWTVTHSASPPETGCPEEDWTVGAPTTTECMPESDRTVFLEEEFFESQGTPIRRLVEPAEWCRADLVQQRLYWPREAGADCAVWPQAQIDMSTAANASRQYWEGLGCQDHYKPHTVTFEVEFTPVLIDFTGGAFSPLMGNGHIFINSASVQANEDFRIGAVLHELAHAAIQFSIFPSAIADGWGQLRLWPEALATAAMINNMPGSSYWADLHGPFPDMWRDGLKFGPNKARHAALLILYLEENEGFNSCQFMLDNHSSLLNGDEIGAFLNDVTSFRYKFADFVFAYNTRVPSIPGIELLPASAPFVLSQPGPNALAVLNGIKDGETFLFTISEPRQIVGAYWKHSTRCPGYTFNRATHRPDGTKVSEQTYTEASTNSVNMYFHDPGTYSITISSPEGTAHMEEFVISELDRFELPASPWPAPALDDPYPSGCP